MTLIKSGFPWNDLSDFFEDNRLRTAFAHGDWSPAINVIDNEKNYEIEVAAPGIKKDDFNVSVENGLLTISGQTQKEKEEKKKNYTRKEFSSHSFSKSFMLPENVSGDDVKASYDHGVLKLVLEKKAAEITNRKEITIS